MVTHGGREEKWYLPFDLNFQNFTVGKGKHACGYLSAKATESNIRGEFSRRRGEGEGYYVGKFNFENFRAIG